MSISGTVKNTSADNTTAASVSFLQTLHPSYPSIFTIECYAVDSNGDHAVPAAGTGALEIKVPGSTQWQTVYEADGTTAVTFTFNETGVVAKCIDNSAAQALRVTPTSLSASHRVYLAVNFS